MSEAITENQRQEMLTTLDNSSNRDQVEKNLKAIKKELKNSPSQDFIKFAEDYITKLNEINQKYLEHKHAVSADTKVQLSNLKEEVKLSDEIKEQLKQLKIIQEIDAPKKLELDGINLKSALACLPKVSGSDFNSWTKVGYVADGLFDSWELGKLNKLNDEYIKNSGFSGKVNTAINEHNLEKYLIIKDSNKQITTDDIQKADVVAGTNNKNKKKDEVEKRKKIETTKNFNEEKVIIANLLEIKDLGEVNLISAFKTINSTRDNIGNESDDWKKVGYEYESKFFKGAETEQLNELLKVSKNEKYSKIFEGISYFYTQGKTIRDYNTNLEQIKKINPTNVYSYLSDRSYNNKDLLSKNYTADKSEGILTEDFLLRIFLKKEFKIENITQIMKRGGYKGELGHIENEQGLVDALKKEPLLKEFFLKGADSLGRNVKAYLKSGATGYEDNMKKEKQSLEKLGLNSLILGRIDAYISDKSRDPKISNELKSFLSYLKENKTSIIDRLKIDFIGVYGSFLNNRTGGGIGTSVGFDNQNDFWDNLKIDFSISNINGVFLPTIGMHYSKETKINEKGDWFAQGTIGTILIFPYATLGIRKITNIDEFKNLANTPTYTDSIIAGLYAGTGKNFSLMAAGVYGGNNKDYKEGIKLGEEQLSEGLSKLLDGIKKVADLDVREKEILDNIRKENISPNEKNELIKLTTTSLERIISEVKPQLVTSGFDNSSNKLSIIDNIKNAIKLKFRETSAMQVEQAQEAYRLFGFIQTFGYRFTGWVVGINILGALTGTGLPIFAGVEGQKIEHRYEPNKNDMAHASINQSEIETLKGSSDEVVKNLSEKLGKKVEFVDGFIIINGIDDIVLHIQKGANVKIEKNKLFIGELGVGQGIFYDILSTQKKEDKNLYIGTSKQIPESTKDELKTLESNRIKPYIIESAKTSSPDLVNEIPDEVKDFTTKYGKTFHTLLQNGQSKTFIAFKDFTKSLDNGDLDSSKIALFAFLDNGFKKNELGNIKEIINKSPKLGGIFNKFKQYMAVDAYSIEKVGNESETREEFNKRINNKRESTITNIKNVSGLKFNNDIIYVGKIAYNLRGSNLLGLRDYFVENNELELAKNAKMLNDLNMNNVDLYTKIYPGAGNSRKDAFERSLKKTGLGESTQKQIQEGYKNIQTEDHGWISNKEESSNKIPVGKMNNTFALMWDSKIATGGSKKAFAGSYFSAMSPGNVEFADGKSSEINPSNDLISLFEKKAYYKEMYLSFQNHFKSQGITLNELDFKKLLLYGSATIDGKQVKLSKKFITFGYGVCNNPSIGLVLGELTIGENKPLALTFAETGSVITNEPVILDKKVAAGSTVGGNEDKGGKGNKTDSTLAGASSGTGSTTTSDTGGKIL